MDLLIDVNVALDVCAERKPHAEYSAAALQHCINQGGSLWLYVGSVQTLEYNLFRELRRSLVDDDTTVPGGHFLQRARDLLKAFSADKQWLAALAEEGEVFDAEDPEDEQLIRALGRFPLGAIKLLTRDERLCQRHPGLALTPARYLGQAAQPRSLDFIDLKTQQNALRPQLERNIHRVLHHGRYILGPEVAELEERLADRTGAGHCVTVASGTEALLISLMALGIGPGDEVITSSFSFAASAEVIALLGARPVFVDIEPDTCNLDATLIEARLSDRTRAILPVSLYGQPADLDAINAIAARHGLPVIEDGAQSFGAEYRRRRSGNLSTIGCTSFFPSKPLGCYGDGGAIFTSDEAIARACREIRIHGQGQRYVHTRIGVGGRMDTLQCAVVLARLERFEEELRRRGEIGDRYNRLMDEAGVARVRQRSDRSSVFAQYTVFVERREQVREALQQAGIPVAVHYPLPLNEQPAYRDLCCPDCTPVAQAAAQRVLSVPMGADLRPEQQDRVMAALCAAVHGEA